MLYINKLRQTRKGFNYMIQKTLDNYSISHSIKDDMSLEYIVHGASRGRHDESNMLISIFNDYDVSYSTGEYLFKTDKALGKRLISSLYDNLSKKNKVVYIEYSNVFRPLQNQRIMQNMWAFPNQATADKFMPQMINELTWIKHTHLFKLPEKPDFNQDSWSDGFLDTYFDQEREHYTKNYLAKHHYDYKTRADRELAELLDVKHLSNEFLDSLGQHKSDLGEFARALEYNERVDKFIRDRKNKKTNIKKLKLRATRLHHEYNSFFGGIETKSDTAAINNLIGKLETK